MKMNLLIWLGTLICLSCGCLGPSNAASGARPDSSPRLVAAVRNTDVKWDGNYYGLTPSLSGPSKELLAKPSELTISLLIEALSDEQRYIAAHVLLTKWTQPLTLANSDSFNGLFLSLLPNGKIHVPVGEQAFLVRQWTEWKDRNKASTGFPACSPNH